MTTLSRALTIQTVKAMAQTKPTIITEHWNMNEFARTADMMNPEDIIAVFKDYKPLDNGNSKLAKGIFSFSLLPVVTCDQHCKGCYDVRSLRYESVRLKRIVNTLLAASHRSFLIERITKQIANAKTLRAVRIHVGGDFFSASYAEMWASDIMKFITVNRPHVKVYTYTKTNHTMLLTMAGINVVQSRYKDHFNFADLETVKGWAKKWDGVVCPATIMGKKTPDGFCGDKCTHCIDKSRVFFVIH